MGKGPRMSSSQFAAYRQQLSSSSSSSSSSSRFGFPLLPSNFFQSREEIRTWGVEDLTDPSVQPYDKECIPRPFHVSLPGYAPRLCKFVLTKPSTKPSDKPSDEPSDKPSDKPSRESFLGPEISIFPPTWVPSWSPDPNFKPQKFGYNWEESESFKMGRLPYVNAEFAPASGEATHMYHQAYPFAAYPYGVPRV
uniref:Uncharacterized protein n=1 Tax=Eimeria tenella TaxID=5802 RepID=H9B9Y7_EIMTE|nr:hypothetical protein [Eimeria tenella]